MRIAGLDEVGRGPLFGPVVAAAVILAPGFQPGYTQPSSFGSPAPDPGVLSPNLTQVSSSYVLSIKVPVPDRPAQRVLAMGIGIGCGRSSISSLSAWPLSAAHQRACRLALHPVEPGPGVLDQSATGL